MCGLQRVALLGAVLTCVPAAAAAQQPSPSFQQLRALIGTGDALVVATTDGREVRGKVSSLSASALEIATDNGPRILAEADVRSISRRDSPWNGMLWWMAAGAVLGSVAEESIGNDYNEGSDGSLAVLGAVTGAGIGFLLDAISRHKVIFNASPARGGGVARISLRW